VSTHHATKEHSQSFILNTRSNRPMVQRSHDPAVARAHTGTQVHRHTGTEYSIQPQHDHNHNHNMAYHKRHNADTASKNSCTKSGCQVTILKFKKRRQAHPAVDGLWVVNRRRHSTRVGPSALVNHVLVLHVYRELRVLFVFGLIARNKGHQYNAALF